MQDDVTLDALSGPWKIHQRRKGHRWSIDDLVTAWVAVKARPDARTHLDLGCGIGSVLMLCAYKLREARHVGVEAQEQSAALCRLSLEHNGLTPRVELRNHDFRAPEALRPDEKFELITGTPPYFPVGSATVPRDSQKAHARMELRGGVEDYCLVASQHLREDGIFVVCGDGRRPDRTMLAAERAGLHVHAMLDLIPHPEKGPLFHVATLKWTKAPFVAVSTLNARLPNKKRAPEMQSVRAFFDMPPMPGEDD